MKVYLNRRRHSARESAKRYIEERGISAGRTLELRVSGDCMGDALPDGSMARIELARDGFPPPGTIVCLRRGDRRLVHRQLFSIGPLGFEKGDKYWLPRPYLKTMLIGRVVGSE